MIRLVKTNLRDIPVAADRVERRVSVFGVAPLDEVITHTVRDEVRDIALALLGAEPVTESARVLVQSGTSLDGEGLRVREAGPGSLFEVDDVPFQLRDAPLMGEGVFILALSAEVTVPELFEVDSGSTA